MDIDQRSGFGIIDGRRTFARSFRARLNQRMITYQFSVPVDPDYSKQWHLHTAFDDPDYDTRSCSLCEDSWSLLDDFGSEEVIIAVTDHSCKLDHHDFDSPEKFAGGVT